MGHLFRCSYVVVFNNYFWKLDYLNVKPFVGMRFLGRATYTLNMSLQVMMGTFTKSFGSVLAPSWGLMALKR